MSIDELADRAPGSELAPPADRPGPDRRLVRWCSGPAAIWVGSRLLLVGFVLLISYLNGVDRQLARTHFGQWAVARFTWWDAGHFLRIARQGYPPHTCCDQAFFPGYPALIRVGSVFTGGSLRVSALLVTALAATAAASLIWRLAYFQAAGQLESDRIRTARRATIYLAIAPYGIFLSATYSEATFLAVGLAAWLAGSQRRWWLAGVLAGGACVTRLNGVFLVVALVVMYLGQVRQDRQDRPEQLPGRLARLRAAWPVRADALALLIPIASFVAFMAWLHHSTGSWDAWQQAEIKGWQREKATPWTGLRIGWHAVANPISHGHWDIALAPGIDFLATMVGLALAIVLAFRRRWPEAVYLALSVIALICSTSLVSGARYAVTWFPAYILIATFTVPQRRRWLHAVIVVCCVPLLAYFSVTFARHAWVD